MRIHWGLAAVLLAGCGGEAPESDPVKPGAGVDQRADGKADGANGGLVYSSATTVEALKEDLSSVSPRVRRVFAGDALSPAVYLRVMSCLGYYGPIGPYGPLGLLGPVGENVWNPSRYVSGGIDWHLFSNTVTEDDGPLSAEGPLGEQGPLNPANWAALGQPDPDDSKRVYANDFIAQLAPGGVWSALGPIGPLGALGPLGPLGPVGAHGFVADADGHYTVEEGTCPDGKDICRTVDVPWNASEVRTYGLFERYPAEVASAMTDNDTSFMAEGSIADPDEPAVGFAFTSAESQWVTVTLVPDYARFTLPEAMTILYGASLIGYRAPTVLAFYPWYYTHATNFDDFDLTLEVTDAQGKSLGTATSDSGERTDWIQLHVPAGAHLKASVSLYKAWYQVWRSVDPAYRLIVVGSGAALTVPAVTGKHIRPLAQ